MSINDRLTSLEQKISGEFPDFRKACNERWSTARWFHALAKVSNIIHVRDAIREIYESGFEGGFASMSEDELRQTLADWPEGKEIDPPEGAIPPAPKCDA